LAFASEPFLPALSDDLIRSAPTQKATAAALATVTLTSSLPSLYHLRAWRMQQRTVPAASLSLSLTVLEERKGLVVE
jgi:hypothetical protein